MGTRSATGVRIDGADKLSYNQFDGYPSHTGVKIAQELELAFAFNDNYELGLIRLRELARGLRCVHSGKKPMPAERKFYADALDPNVSSGDDWYAQLRNDQNTIIQRLLRGVATWDSDFVNDSLFCEWAYVLNLDDETLEVYAGYMLSRGKGRYAEAARPRPDGKYWPVSLIATWPLRDYAEFAARMEQLEKEHNQS